MPTPKRPRDGNQIAKPVVDMATGEVRHDKGKILNPPEPAGRASSAKTRAASQTPERRRKVSRQAASARWDTDDGNP